MSSMHTVADVPMHIRSENASSERRVSPAWNIAQFKTRLEPITGIPSTSQSLILKLGSSQTDVAIEATNEEQVQLSSFNLQPYADIQVVDTRPTHLRQSYSLTDPNLQNVEKYTMPSDTYASLPNSVLAYKRANQLGRFDPTAPSQQEAQIHYVAREIEERRIAVGRRCRLLPPPGQRNDLVDTGDDDRRGAVAFIGDVEDLPGIGAWIGIKLDEPTGKNDGTVKGKEYFDCGGVKRGVFVRPERVEVGEFPVVDAFAEELEEI